MKAVCGFLCMAGGGYSGSALTQAIKDRISIVDLVRRYVNLRHAGGPRWVGPCPFHQETKGSFSVNEEQGFFYCFGCQASGDIFDFYARVNGLEFKEALAGLADEAGVSIEKTVNPAAQKHQDIRKRSLKMHELAKTHFMQNLSLSFGKNCREYIASRALDEKIVQSFELGWSRDEWDSLAQTLQKAGFTKEQGAESGLLIKSERGSIYDRFRSRFMFPIKNLSGQVIAFGGRIIDDADTAKYINSSDSPIYKKGDNVYGLFQARRAISAKKSVILTEGYMDVLTLHQYGYENSCGVLGTALTPEQVKRLGGFCSYFELIFDGDPPGRKAAMRGCEMILAKGLNCKVVLLPEKEDIDSLLKTSGTQAFESLRRNAPDGLTFCMRTLNSSFAPREISLWVKSFMESLEQAEHKSRYLALLAQGLGLDEASLRKQYVESVEKNISAGFSAENRYKPKVSTVVKTQEIDSDKQFMVFAVRYPKYAGQLKNSGIEFAISKPWACALWRKIIACSPLYAEEDIFALLQGQEKQFWISQRMNIPPEDAQKEERELNEICRSIKRIIEEKQNASRTQALSTLKGDDYETEFLKAIHEKLTGKSLVEKKNE